MLPARKSRPCKNRERRSGPAGTRGRSHPMTRPCSAFIGQTSRPAFSSWRRSSTIERNCSRRGEMLQQEENARISPSHVETKWRTRSSDYRSAVFTNKQQSTCLQTSRNRSRESQHTFQTVLTDLKVENRFESWE